ncbi:uncharacterized protein [Aegilops tauschii subsp. strangulata]|uniref:uncharacterized protein isoform X1 n=1 Tax=Aegilops tauschii subsp. strangulata TaxID=200361 RepID=UPI001ABCA403|nr:uncharacterized protein LOC120969840 isoform X1 [Aegilops tauschii subsp. strangulata]
MSSSFRPPADGLAAGRDKKPWSFFLLLLWHQFHDFDFRAATYRKHNKGEGSEEGWRGRLSCIGSLPLARPSCRRWTRWRLAPSSLSVSKYSSTRSVHYFHLGLLVSFSP